MKPLIKVQGLPLKPDHEARRASPRPASAPAPRRIPAAPTPTSAPPVKAEPQAEPATLLSDTAERLSLDWSRQKKARLEYVPEADFTAGEPGSKNPLYNGEKKPPKWLGKSF